MPLPWAKISRGIRLAAEHLSPHGFWDAAEAIRTTDEFAKGSCRRLTISGEAITVAGFAKGAGMIHPRMATTLGYVMTDAAIDAASLRGMLARGAEQSFNAISVDGDTSTNDTLLLLASGASRARLGRRGAELVGRAVNEVLADLARMIVADGEGATKVVAIEVRGAKTPADADRAARAVANSVLVKTAFHGADPNWGRIACAVGYSGAAVRAERLDIRIGGVAVCRGSAGTGAAAERRARKAMLASEFTVEIDLGAGRGGRRLLTSDLGPAYVRFNSEYSS